MSRPLTIAALALGVFTAAACHCGPEPSLDGGSVGGSTAGGGSAGGMAGGEAGGTAGGASAGGAAGGQSGGFADAGSTARLPRLVVASRGDDGGSPSVRIWDHANALAADVAAPVALAGSGASAAALAADLFHLYVVREASGAGEAVLQRFDLPRELDNGAVSAATLTTVELGATLAVNKVQLDDIGALWLERSPGEVLRIDRVAAGAATPPSAIYRHAFTQIFGFAFEQTNNRLFAGQVSGAGVLVWNDANTLLGDAGVHSFQLSTDDLATIEISGGRLYGSFFRDDVKVWNGIGTASSPRPFAFALSADAGTAVSVRDLRVSHGHLVVTVQPTPSTGRVLIYENVGVTFANRAPDVVVDDPILIGAQKAVLGADGTLYVLDARGVAIFTGALASPALAVKLTVGLAAPADLLLVE